MCYEWYEVNVLIDINGVDQLSWTVILIWVFEHVHQVTLLYGNDNALERDSTPLDELPVLLNTPVEAYVHIPNIIQCV